MCGIIGITGNFKVESLINGLNSIKHRGPDFSGIYVSNNINNNDISSNNIDNNNDNVNVDNNENNTNNKLFEYIIRDSKLDNIKDIVSCEGLFKQDFNIGLGHNLLSIFNNSNINNTNLNNNSKNNNAKNINKRNNTSINNSSTSNYQPIIHNDLIMVYNGEIYNFDELSLFLTENSNSDNNNINNNTNNNNIIFEDNYNNTNIESDGELLVKLIQYFLDDNKSNNINGNNDNNNTATSTTITSNNHNSLLQAVESVKSIINGDYAFAVYDGENIAITRDPVGVKPLYYSTINNYHDYKNDYNVFASEKRAIKSIGNTHIKTLAPGATLYNWELVDSNFSAYNINSNKLSNADINININNMDYGSIKEKIKSILVNSTLSRVNNIDNVGIIFSGGLDSAIIAKILSDNNINVALFSVGAMGSQDLEFSTKLANKLNLKLKKCIVNEDILKDNLDPVLIAINEYENFYSNEYSYNNVSINDSNANNTSTNTNSIDIIKLGVGMTIYLASKLAAENNISVILSGQGADELFAGYDRYRRNYSKYSHLEEAKIAIKKELKYDLDNIARVNLERDDAVTMANSVELRVPFLDKNLINLSTNIPLNYKIKGEDDFLRKHILRDIAKDFNLPEYSYNRPKKAAQYGSGIHKLLIKKVLKNR